MAKAVVWRNRHSVNRLVLAGAICAALSFSGSSSAQVYDFVANAGSAGWQSTGGSLTFPAGFTPTLGGVQTINTQLEDGVTVNHIWSHPPTSGTAPYWLEGTYNNIAIPSTGNLYRFEAQVGFENGANLTTGLIFSVWIQQGTEWHQLSSLEAKYDTLLNTLAADLTSYKGKTINIKIRIDAGTDTSWDWGAWKGVQIVAYGTTILDLVSGAAGAGPWTNGLGNSVTFGNAPTAAGGALLYTGTGEDSVSYTNALEMVPDRLSGSPHFMQGKFTAVSIPTTYAAVKFLARVGFTSGASGTDGAICKLLMSDGAGGYIQLAAVSAKYDNRFDYLTADLTPYKGMTKDLFLRVEAGGTATLDLALWTEARLIGHDPQMVCDLNANAGKAIWTSGAGALTFPTNSSNGVAQYDSSAMEAAGSYPNHLFTHPNFNGGATQWFIMAQYNNVIIPNNFQNVRFNATVGFHQGASGSTGVTYLVSVVREGKTDAVCSVVDTYDNLLKSLSADLTGFQGQNVSIVLYVDANGSPNSDWACWIKPQITAELPMQVYAKDAGAVVNDSNDDLTALNRGLDLANSVSPGELILQSGTYNLSNRFNVTGRSNLNIKGSATSAATNLVYSNSFVGAFLVTQSKNIATRNVTVDYNPLPFTQGTVSNVNLGAKTFTLTIDSGYRPLGDFAPPADPSCWGLFHNSTAPYRQVENGCDWMVLTAWSGGPTVYNCTANRMDGAANGMKFMYHKRAENILVTSGCLGDGHILWDNTTVWSGPGLVFVGVGSDKIYVRNSTVQIKPSTTRIKSTNGDGVHTQSCASGPDVIGCKFSGMSDDGFNTYATAYEIVEADAAKTRLSVYAEGRPLGVGDKLTLFRPSNGTLGATVSVVTFHQMKLVGGFWCHDITVSAVPIADLQVGWNNDQFYSQTYGCSGWLVAKCEFKDYRGQGILSKAANGLAVNNTFSYLSGSALELANSPSFDEGLQNLNVKILNNTITHCGFFKWFINDIYAAPIAIRGRRDDFSPSVSNLHDGIVVQGNTMTDWARNAVYVSTSANVSIAGNNLTNTTTGVKASSGYRGIMFFEKIDNVSVTSNAVVDQRPSNQITGKLFLKTSPLGELTVSGNSYTTNLPGGTPEITQLP